MIVVFSGIIGLGMAKFAVRAEGAETVNIADAGFFFDVLVSAFRTMPAKSSKVPSAVFLLLLCCYVPILPPRET